MQAKLQGHKVHVLCTSSIACNKAGSPARHSTTGASPMRFVSASARRLCRISASRCCQRLCRGARAGCSSALGVRARSRAHRSRSVRASAAFTAATDRSATHRSHAASTASPQRWGSSAPRSPSINSLTFPGSTAAMARSATCARSAMDSRRTKRGSARPTGGSDL